MDRDWWAGMVDPTVSKACYDAKVWSGYAFGMGLERLAMLLYGIDDIRISIKRRAVPEAILVKRKVASSEHDPSKSQSFREVVAWQSRMLLF